MTARSRAATSRLFRVLALLQDKAHKGNLPENCRWILDSRLVFLKKKKGPAPRPVRVGEVWRRIIAKKIVFDAKDFI